ncbi:MAG: LacI family transcriptional regulator [Anaerolineaceae bacterium]|nr:MAG: LacI family transcriptional regulator [Anaerolineaceae bacterium]
MSSQNKLTAKEIAFQLGISQATVSLAMNDKPGVNSETKRRILEYIAKQENKVQLFGGTILHIMYVNREKYTIQEENTLFNYGYVEFLRMVQQERMELQLQNVYSIEEMLEALKASTDKALGVVFCAADTPLEAMPLLDECDVPLVVYSSDLMGDRWDAVCFHNEKAVKDGMALLEKNGHKDIVYLLNDFHSYNFRARRRAYQQYIFENAIDGRKPQFVPTGMNVDKAAQAIAEYLRGRNKLPDAIFSENYMTSIALSIAAQQLRIKIPQDMSIIGIDAIPEAIHMPYNMDHYSVPHAERMRIVGEMLFTKLKNNNLNIHAREVRISMKYQKGDTIAKRNIK